jgi:dTDP-4-amino-4,6-dideoxygalactose transaminase
MNKKKIYLSPPHLTGEEQKYLQYAFKTNWIAPVGDNIDGFEQDICNYTNSNYCTVLSSGTASIHLALRIIGVKKGDTVICPTFTFVASVNPVLYLGATPIFVDSEKETLNMDPNLLEKTIRQEIHKGNKPKAIILVHIYGMPAKINEILEIANRYNILVVEDAADTLGAKYNNQHVGTFGEMGIFSFNGNKIITTSGGGALITKIKESKQKAEFLATQARDTAPHYQHSEIGYNYRMSNVLAGIGRGQMEVLEQRIKARRANYNFYKNELASIKEIIFTNEPKGFYSNRWLTTILTESFKQREKIRIALEKENIESRPLWKPMHLQPIFKNYPAFLNGVSDDLFDKGLCLPSGSNLKESDLKRIVSVIKNCYR